MRTRPTDPTRPALELIEARRLAARRPRLSIRRAAQMAGISEANWRQLVRGYALQGGARVPRRARRDQLLDMAAAVGCLEEVARMTDAGPDEVADARERVAEADPAREEILRSQHLTDEQKLRVLAVLREMRAEPPQGGEGESAGAF